MKPEEELEMLIDRHGLAHVLDMLSDVCAEKAEHIESTWDDRGLAKLWHRAGVKVRAAALSPAVKGLP
jgi:hypothetical protein